MPTLNDSLLWNAHLDVSPILCIRCALFLRERAALHPKAVADLARSGIDPDTAEAAGIFYVDDASTICSDFLALPALVIPYFDVYGEPVGYGTPPDDKHFCRIRYLEEPTCAKSFVKKKAQRYTQPSNSGVRAYFPLGLAWAQIAGDSRTALILTEGEKKTVAAIVSGFPCVGLGGVFNFSAEGGLLSELDAFKWHGRDVYIVFDSDAAMNPNIQLAEARLVDELMKKRGAKVYLVRLPHNSDGSKCGLDDYLVANGSERFRRLCGSTDALGAVDAAVVAMNQYVAWIERDGQVYDVAARHFLRADAFTKGSKYSAEKARRVITNGKTPGVKEVGVAAEWLTHALSRRYADLLFRPGDGEMVQTESGANALNIWQGFAPEAGDVTPFLELDRFIMSRTPEEHRTLPLKLMAYKAQHPAEKIPLATVLVGEQGSGKSLWASCLAAAFAPYSTALQSDSLTAPFQGWLERTLLAVINEAEAEDILEGYPRLKALISDLVRPMNEKYRVARQIHSYTQYILTANEKAAAAFPADDRRMVVIGCPSKHEFLPLDFYRSVAQWRDNGGGKALLSHLLTMDLQGWCPPARAPLTPEKAMAFQESLTPVAKLASDTSTATENTILLWIDAAMIWANAAATGAGVNPLTARFAQEIVDSYNSIQIRPWYTPEEIAMMFPQIAATLYGNRKVTATVSGDISRQLRDCGVPYLECADDPRGFHWRGRIHQFLVIAQREDWRQPLKQVEFERIISSWPRYAEVRQTARRGAKQ